MLVAMHKVDYRTCLAVPVFPDRPPDESELEDPDEPRPPGLPPPRRFSNIFVVVSSVRSFSENAVTLVRISACRRDISSMRPSTLSGVTNDMLKSMTAVVRVSLMVGTVSMAGLCMRRQGYPFKAIHHLHQLTGCYAKNKVRIEMRVLRSTCTCI